MNTGNAPMHEFDLEDRTFKFAKAVRDFVKTVPHTIANAEDVKQVVRASGSVGANYIEANEALSKKDFVMRLKICRKEAKESSYYLRLLTVADEPAREALVSEGRELLLIFSSIIRKNE